MPIKIVTICGSVRPGNYTSMALALALSEFAKRSDVDVDALDLAAFDLPFPGRGHEIPPASGSENPSKALQVLSWRHPSITGVSVV